MFNEIQWKKFEVLDHGYVSLVDKMGDDSSVTQAAKVSFGNDKEEETPEQRRTLIRYLMRHRHSSPFEMVELKFLIRCPIFVARQWMRHRTWSYNEISGRYTQLPDDYYTPEEWRLQSKNNKQGSEGVSSEDHTEEYYEMVNNCKESYGYFNSRGVAQELSRCVLPVSTYTEFYSKVDLANLFHFISLRSDTHAQYEIRVYSDVILNEIIKPLFPLCYEAFVDYRTEGIFLTRLDKEVIRQVVRLNTTVDTTPEVQEILKSVFKNKRERDECYDKLLALGIM